MPENEVTRLRHELEEQAQASMAGLVWLCRSRETSDPNTSKKRDNPF